MDRDLSRYFVGVFGVACVVGGVTALIRDLGQPFLIALGVVELFGTRESGFGTSWVALSALPYPDVHKGGWIVGV